jgi:hypothetical protein
LTWWLSISVGEAQRGQEQAKYQPSSRRARRSSEQTVGIT